MSFDPSLYYQHGAIAGPDQSTDTGGGGGGAPATTSSAPNVQDLGNGYSLVSWTDPDTGLTKTSIVPNKDAASVAAVEAAKIGAGAAGVSASITAGAANQRAAVQAEIDRAKNAADAAHQAAMDALANGNAAEARRQFDISSAELQRYHTLDVGIRQQEANTSAQTAGYNIYKDLTDKASNPRNFMQQFFTNRGQAAPPGSAAYGNTATGPGGIMPFEKWLPNFMTQTLGSYGQPSGAGAGSPPAASAPSPSGGYGGQGNPSNPYAGTNMNYGGSPTEADTAMINGVKTWAGGAYSGKPVASSPADAGDLTPYLKNPNAGIAAFAGGGSLRMTAPHAIVNMLSGKVAAIAGEQKGKGPQGFVPETAKFSGQAIIDPNKTNTGEPVPVPPVPPDATPPDTAPPPSTTTPPATIAPPSGTPAPAPAPAPGIPGLGTQPAPPGFHWVGTQLVPNPVAAPAPSPAPTPIPTPTMPAPIFGPAINPGGANPWGGSTTTPPNPANLVPTPEPFLTGPSGTPRPGSGGPLPPPLWNSPLSSTPSGLGQNPTFLPEDAAAKDPILAQMLQQGAFPPFLQRLYAQAKGLPGLGTNVPQTTNLPNDVPLISQIALNQMSPSEFQAFQSFLSAHGIDWNDYVAMVQAASPQGGTSRSNAVPRFLSQ